MKAKFCFAVVLFMCLSLFLVIQIYAADFSWKDDFNYESLTEMQTAGWVIENPSGTSLQSEGVVIDGTGSDTVIRFLNFPEGIYDWSVETRSMWLAVGHSGPGLNVNTENHVYSFSGDGWYNDLNFDRDGETETIGSYADQTNWVTMTLTKKGNTIKLYFNGELVKAIIEEDTSPSGLTGVARIAPWKGIMLYDYYQINGAAVASSGDFPILYIAIGGGAAGAVSVGVAAYWYFFLRKAPPVSSPSPHRRFSLSSRGKKLPKGTKPGVNMANVNTGWGDSVQVTETEVKPSTGIKPPESNQFEKPASSESRESETSSKSSESKQSSK